jgi:glycosyltransferase involved in cell wall biosynthesis
LQLVVAGDGVDRVLVETAARTGNVKWFPMVPYRDVAGLVARARVAVVPQLASPRARIGLSPLKLFEAMACATPVVVSDLPGLNDVVRATGCGVVVPPGDPRALARAVREMVYSEVEPEEMGKRGRAAVLGQYSWDARAGATDAVLRRVLSPEWAARASGVRHGSSPSDP